MSGQKDIEARLDRALQEQVRKPDLDRRFNAAVWARIAAEEAKASNPGAVMAESRVARASRWLAITNYVGVAATLVVALYFGLRTFGGMETPTVDFDLALSVPTLSDEMVTRIIGVLGQSLGLAALVFGLSFTSFGRRLRASLS